MSPSPKPDPSDRLFAEVFHDDWNEGEASAAARRAASEVRRRVARRHALMSSGIAIALTLVAVLLATRSKEPADTASNLPAKAPPAASRTSEARGYETIGDDQLIAELHDRAILVVEGPSGHKQITLLQ